MCIHCIQAYIAQLYSVHYTPVYTVYTNALYTCKPMHCTVYNALKHVYLTLVDFNTHENNVNCTHCTMYTLYGVHCTPYNVYTVQCTVYNVHIVRCTLYSVHIVQCTVYIVQCTCIMN